MVNEKETEKKKGVLSIFEVEPEYPPEEDKGKKGKGRSRPEIIDPFGWCSYESAKNKKVTRIYERRKVIKEMVDGEVL